MGRAPPGKQAEAVVAAAEAEVAVAEGPRLGGGPGPPPTPRAPGAVRSAEARAFAEGIAVGWHLAELHASAYAYDKEGKVIYLTAPSSLPPPPPLGW